MSAHTTGPWIAEPSGDIRASMAGTGVGFCIASMNGRNGADEIRANARLIAAAPDLLAAAQQAMLAFTFSGKAAQGRALHADALRKIRAAIAKAEGRT